MDAENKLKEGNNIVVVDDDNDMLNILTFALESEEYHVIPFKSGITALNFLKKVENLQAISLIILDRILPDMDGIEILKELAKNSKHYPPVIFLSLLSAEKDVLEGLKLGAVDYVMKPFSISVLREKVRKQLAKRE